MEECESRTLLSGVSVLTYHNSNARLASNAAETYLTRSNVNSSTFGKKFALPVLGQVFAQPLYVWGVMEPFHRVLTRQNLVIIATEHDWVYAFNADRGSLVWRTIANVRGLETSIPSADTNTDDISPEIGITSTPVIDRSTNTIYLVAQARRVTNGSNQYFTRLYALDVITGRPKGSTDITASVPGTGDASNNGQISFDTLIANQRSALTLVNGNVYFGVASHGDTGPYHGWLFGYNATTLAQTMVWNDTANGIQGGIWESGGGFAADSQGNLYVPIGNGTFDANTGGPDYGQTLVRIPTSGGSAGLPADYFTPFNFGNLNAGDLDFGSSGVLALPTQSGPNPFELVVGGKEGKLYVLDRTNLGQLGNGSDNIIQTVAPTGFGIYDSPAFYNNRLFYAASNGPLVSFDMVNGQLVSTGQSGPSMYNFPGANPSISANGNSDGIVWIINTDNNGTAVLSAFSTDDISAPLYSSTDNSGRDQAGTYVKFTTPTIANGKVFVGVDNEVDVYGLL